MADSASEEKSLLTHVEHVSPVEEIDGPSQVPQEQEKGSLPGKTSGNISLHKPGEPAETSKPVTLTLLKQLHVWVQADDGTRVEVKLRGGENAIRLLILAYIA